MRSDRVLGEQLAGVSAGGGGTQEEIAIIAEIAKIDDWQSDR
jgi:hypothetical protein